MERPTACPHPFPFVWHRNLAQVDADERRAAETRARVELAERFWRERRGAVA